MKDPLFQDTRYALRTLTRTPGFMLAALLTLALGIGANTAIFSVVNAVLLRPLPYPEPDRIVSFLRKSREGEWTGHTGRRFMFFRDHLQSFESFAAWRNPTGLNLSTDDRAEYVSALPVSKEYFNVFGVAPLHGASFSAHEDSPNGPLVAVLGHALWQQYFGGDPSAIGRTVVLGDRPHTIVGVMPASFSTVPTVDLFVPLRTSTTGPGGGFNYRVAGRLKAGVTRETAIADAAVVHAAFGREFPNAVGRSDLAPTFVDFQTSVSSYVRGALLMMLGAVGLLLLIACANTANLLLARASGRAREISVRAALGASRSRIVRQLLTESALLALAGACLGVLFAYWAVPALLGLTPPGFTVYQTVTVDGTVLIATLVIAVLTGVLFGLAPAVTLSRQEISSAFRDHGTRATAGRRTAWLRNGLVVSQVAVCMVLLVGAGLLLQTFVNKRAVDPGFDLRGVLTARMSLQGDRYLDPASLVRFFDLGLERIRRLPGVQSAAVVNGVPIEYGLNLNVDILDGPEELENQLTDWRYASADYLRTMGIAIVAGRGFDERDSAGAPPVTVVNEEFARRFFKGSPALGRHVRIFDTDGDIEIVGIARNVREQGLIGSLPAVMYVPIAQANPAGVRASHLYFPMSWVVRATSPNAELVRRIQDEIRAIDPRQPFSAFKTMEDVKGESIADERFQTSLVGAFAIIGLLLASAGIYGVIAYSVAQRTPELGIRMALGAGRGRILRSVLGQGGALAAAGVAIGALAGIWLARVLQNFVWGVSPADPLTYVVVGGVLIGVAILASIVPALRAVKLDPMRALRE